MNKIARISLILAAGLFAVAFFFRQSLLSGFEYVPGDIWDGRLLFGIVDHWRQFFAGECAWNDLRIFWPVTNTLAYSDTFFIEGVPYAALCALGVNQFVAYTLVFMAQAFVGYLSMYWLLRRFFGVQWGLAAAFAVVFVNLSGMQLAIDSSHLQMTIAWLCPLFVGMLWRLLENGPRAWLLGVGAAVLLSLMFFSAFYMTWFMAFFLCIMAALRVGVFFVVPSKEGFCCGLRGKFGMAMQWISLRWRPFSAFAGTFAVTIMPFLLLYLPASREFGHKRFQEVLRSLPGPLDFINVGERSVVWGGLMRLFHVDHRPYSGELNFGIPPFTLLLFFIAAGFLLVWHFRGKGKDMAFRVTFVTAAAAIASWILLYRHHSDSAWYFVLKGVPGAGALRAVFRMNLLVASSLVVVLAVWISRWAKGWWIGLAAVLVFGVFLDQAVYPKDASRMMRHDEEAIMARIPPPPDDARIFFMIPPFDSGAFDMVQQQMRALLVAGKYRLHTPNGHSGLVPLGWGLKMKGERYYRNLAQWLEDGGAMEGVYGLDAENGRWVRPNHVMEPLPYLFGTNVVSEALFDKYAWAGWSVLEKWGVWSEGKHARLRLAIPADAGDLVIRLAFHSYNPKEIKQRVTMRVNGKEVGRWVVGRDEHFQEVVGISADEVKAGSLDVVFDLPDAVSPQSVGGAGDSRLLGMGLDSFVVEKAR